MTREKKKEISRRFYKNGRRNQSPSEQLSWPGIFLFCFVSSVKDRAEKKTVPTSSCARTCNGLLSRCCVFLRVPVEEARGRQRARHRDYYNNNNNRNSSRRRKQSSGRKRGPARDNTICRARRVESKTSGGEGLSEDVQPL